MKNTYVLQKNRKKIKFTPEGYQKLKTDLEVLTERRKKAVISLRTAREMGDLSENGAYKAARFELSDVDRTIRRLNYLLRFGEIADVSSSNNAGFGKNITLTDGKQELKFLLVDGFESNPQTHKFSLRSPIGKAILGKQVGDKVTVLAPKGAKEYTILEIE